jgi:LysR family transcriptional regulator for metE and metH
MFLELRHLRSLQAIHDSGSLARAAEGLHLTQSALSHQVKALENYFEVPLFLRNTKPLRLTSSGHALVKLAQRVLPEIEGAEAKLKRVADGSAGRLHIAIECHACYEWLLPVLADFRERWPEVEVDIRLGVSFDAIPALQKGDVDLVISSDPGPLADVSFQPLFDYRALLVMAANHPLCDKPHIEPADLQKQTLITYPVQRQRLDVFKRFLQPAGVEPAEVRQAELTGVILMLAASNRGVAVLPDWVLTDNRQTQGLATRRLTADGLHGTLYAAVRSAEQDTPYLKGFIERARDGHGGPSAGSQGATG